MLDPSCDLSNQVIRCCCEQYGQIAAVCSYESDVAIVFKLPVDTWRDNNVINVVLIKLLRHVSAVIRYCPPPQTNILKLGDIYKMRESVGSAWI